MYNKAVLVGRLVRDPELRFTQSGKGVCNFTLAVDRGHRDGKKETDFIDVVVWDKQAETVAKYLEKGRMALVDGRIQVRKYEAKDGTKRTVYEVVAENVRFLPDGHTKKENTEEDNGGGGFDPSALGGDDGPF